MDAEDAIKNAIADYEAKIADLITANPWDPVGSAWVDALIAMPEPVRRGFLASFGERRGDFLFVLRRDQRARLNPPTHPFDTWTVGRAVSRGEVAVARDYLEHGEDPNAQVSSAGEVLLHSAAEGKFAEVVRLFLAAGANASTRSAAGMEPLQRAVEQPPRGGEPERRADQLAIVKMLLDAGASPNPQLGTRRFVEVPLYTAAKLGDAEIARILIAHGADPNRESPLVEAVNYGSLEVVHAILEAPGVDVNQRQPGGATALVRSVQGMEVVIKWKKYDEATARERMFEITKALLAAGADRTLADDSGNTALSCAVDKAEERLFDLL